MGGGGGWVVAYSILVSAQGPLVWGLGRKGLGLRVWGQGLTKRLFFFLSEIFIFQHNVFLKAQLIGATE